MAPKRGKNDRDGSAGAAGSKPWEAALSSAVLQEECWCVCVSLVVCDSVYDEVCMRALCHAVQQPLRSRFTLLSWENLLQKVNDLGNPKTRKIKELPASYEVTEVARSVLDLGDKLSVGLLAKLVKFQLLDIKNTDIQRRAAGQREAGSGSPGREKNAKGSAKGEKGKKAAEAPPPRKDTKLKRRGDDSTTSYIDDEPDDGPEHYVLMTGFHQPSLISALDSIGVHVSNVIRLKSDRCQNLHVAQEEEGTDTPKEHEFSAGAPDLQQDLSVFWDQLDGVLNSAGFQSRLSDIARLEYRVDQNLLSRDLTNAEGMQEVGVAIFEGVACLLYDSLDWRRQHEHYLSRMRLIHIPNIRPDTSADAVRVRREAEDSAESECVDVDTRLYSDLLDRIPLQCVSVALVLHCLIEQVVSSEQEVCGGSAESEASSDPGRDLICHMMRCVSGLPRSEQENSVLDSLDAVSVEVCMMKKSSVWNTLLSKHLDTNSLNTARRHELLHYCSTDCLSSADVQRLLQMCVFESMPLTAVDASGGHTLAESHTALPWDDPVTFTHTVYCGRDTAHKSTVRCDEQQENKVSVEDLQKTLIRHFRHWIFTEHHNADVFLQVLQTASEWYRCVDSFHSCQSNIMYVICHNPMSPERSSRGSWEVSLHTDVRFRSYLENVAESIRDWSRTELERLQKLQQQQQQETETLDTTTKGVSVVSPVPERSEVFIRHNSLKAWKLEQDRQKDDDVMRNMKKEKEGKSSAKGGERVESSPEDERHVPHISTDLSEAPTHTHNQPFVFTCYGMDGRLVQVRGRAVCLSIRWRTDQCGEISLCTRLDTAENQRLFGCFYAVLSNGLTIAYSHKHQEAHDASLQLHVSLPTGLQIHFNVQHTAHGQAVLVCQSLPSSGSKLPATHTESSRTITCEGTVIRHMRDGSSVVLFADGTVSVSPDSGTAYVTVPTSAGQYEDTSIHTLVKPSSGVGVEGAEPTSKVELKEQVKMMGGSWCTTTQSGVRIRTIRGERVDENPVLTFYSTDPQTHSVVMTRDDGVLCVLEKHRTVVDHADGTRISSSYQQGETVSQQSSGSSRDGGRVSMVKVEKSGFATVMMKCEEKSSEVLFRDGTTIGATAHGSYRVCLPDGGCLSIREDGVAVYSSTGPEGDQCGHYIMSHSEGLVCELTDSDGNHYQVTAEGGVSISHTPTGTESQTQHNIGVDTHTHLTVDEILQKENTDPSVAVIREPIPDKHEAFAITILKPFSDLSSYWLSPKRLDDIIPANLKSRKWDTFPASEVKTHGSPFGVSLGRGLELKERTTLGSDLTPPVLQNPNTLLIRRITEHTPFTQQHYEDLQHKLLLYINQLLHREKLKDEMKLKDPQTVEEKLHHSELHLVQSQSDATPDATPQSMLSLQQKQKSEWGKRIHQHRLDLQEETRHRYALRNHIITPYFHPELQELTRYLHQELKVTSLSPNLP
ncbi:hypothetical protein AMELA_G00266190 [Ameiurus melas]|uniref:Sperm-associated antigen 17 n=1 Tax=Ameiurus melas TaxID=219545 RepID=A0A7J5ZSV1_AMEME|nr:hypothetical protein AMELA_G00266190 [Ameiurus melas]